MSCMRVQCMKEDGIWDLVVFVYILLSVNAIADIGDLCCLGKQACDKFDRRR